MPSCTNQGQTSSGRAWMVTARVALNVGCLTTSSPGMARATSSSVAPQRSCQGRMKRRYTPNEAAPRVANPIPIFLNITGSSLVKVTLKRNLRQHDASDKVKLFSFKHVSSLRMANRLLQGKEYNKQITCHHRGGLTITTASRSWIMHHTNSLSK